MENLIVYQKMLELLEYSYIALRQFPKSEKFGLAADIKSQMYDVLRLIIVVIQIKNNNNGWMFV